MTEGFKLINDAAFEFCKAPGMLAGIERKVREIKLDEILDEFSDSDRSDADLAVLAEKLNRLL